MIDSLAAAALLRDTLRLDREAERSMPHRTTVRTDRRGCRPCAVAVVVWDGTGVDVEGRCKPPLRSGSRGCSAPTTAHADHPQQHLRTTCPTLLSRTSRNLCFGLVPPLCLSVFEHEAGIGLDRRIGRHRHEAGTPCHIRVSGCPMGSGGGTRTLNFRINSPTLCQLSYPGPKPRGPARGRVRVILRIAPGFRPPAEEPRRRGPGTIARAVPQPAGPGGPVRTVGTYSSSWIRPSNVRLATMSRATSGYPS